MDEILQQLIDAYTAAEGDRDARIAAVRAAIAERDDVPDVSALIDEAIDAFQALNGAGDADLSDAQLEQMEALAGVAAAGREIQREADEATAARRERADALAAGLNGDPEGDDDDDADTTGDGDGNSGDGTTDTPADDEGGEGDDAPAGQPVGAGATAAASNNRRTAPRVPLRGVRPARNNGRPSDPRRGRGGGSSWEIRAAADIPGYPSNKVLNGLDELTNAAVEKLGALGRTGSVTRASLATFRRNLPDTHVARNENDYEVIDRATAERNLPGGSLVAAGGWCAPSEIDYGMGVEVASVDGLVDLPTVQMSRGGLRYPTPPDFSAVYSHAGYFHQTEAQAIAGVAKPCYEIPCPGMAEVRLDVEGLCLKAPILTDRAWPEVTKFFISQSMVAHAHRLNAFKIAQMVAKVGATEEITIPDYTVGAELGAIPTVLSALDLAVEYITTRYRLPANSTIEYVGPRWLRPVLRSDLVKRQFADPAMVSVTDAQLDEYLRSRRVNPQHVLDWQDAFATGVVTDFGGDEMPTEWPATVDILLYVAGTYFAGGDELIRLDGLYDSTQLATNTFTALFTEESVGVGVRGYKPYKLTIPICPTGQTSGSVAVTCPTR